MTSMRTVTLTVVLLVNDSDAAAKEAHLGVDRFLSAGGDWYNWGVRVKNVQRIEWVKAGLGLLADEAWAEANDIITETIKEDLGLMPHEEFPKECDYSVRKENNMYDNRDSVYTKITIGDKSEEFNVWELLENLLENALNADDGRDRIVEAITIGVVRILRRFVEWYLMVS